MTSGTARVAEPEHRVAGRVGVPWGSVLPLAVLTCFADGFWLTSLRGAVGAIERTQAPFAGWLRESVTALPLFVVAVTAALLLGLRLLAPRPRGRGVLAVALLVAVATTVAGAAELALSAAYDYHLQAHMLQAMGSLRGACVHGGCLAHDRQASLQLQLRALAVGSGLLLVTNVVVVGWWTALRGGRLETGVSREDGAPAGRRGSRTRVDDLRWLLAAGLAGSAAVHVAVVPEHRAEWPAAAGFFAALCGVELVLAGLVLRRARRGTLLAAAAGSAAPLLVWLWSRTLGLPFGPDPGVPEAVGLPDLCAGAMELVALVAATVALRRARSWRPAVSDHVRWIAVAAVSAVAAFGVVASNPSWFDGGGSIQPTVMAEH